MRKIKRVLNQKYGWKKICQEYQLEIEFQGSMLLIKKNNQVLSIVRSGLHQDMLLHYEEYEPKINIHQKVYMTYATEDEAHLFGIDIGSFVIMVEKSYFQGLQLIGEEQEIAGIDYYVFTEEW